MPSQLLSLVGFQKHSDSKETTLRRASLHKEGSTLFTHHHHYAYREITNSEQLEDDEGSRRREKMKRRKKGQSGAAREIPRFNLWYFTSTISHILRKAKAFYNECSCDAYEDQRVRKVEVTLVDPYFSVPAFPCTSFSNCM